MQIVVTGLNHRTAPVELREQFAVSETNLAEALQTLLALPGVREAVILSTCNRVELYTLEDGNHATGCGSASFFHQFFHVDESLYTSQVYRLYDAKAVEHLFSVSASLDSMIVGEPQILGQVKEFFQKARLAGATGTVFNTLFARAIAVGKRARTETGIGELAVSVPYAAVELARTVFDSLKGKSVAILGRGKMSELVSRHLRRTGVERLYAVGRCPQNAEEFAARIGALPVPFDEDLRFLDQVDILICSTRAPHPLVHAVAVQKAMTRRRNHLLFMVDISVPRVVDPAVNDIENVYLFNIDHLERIVAENSRLRLEEARKVAGMIEEETRLFMEWVDSREVVPTIRAFREHLETLRTDEISRILRNYEGFAPEQRELIEQFSKALIQKIGHVPTVRLKNADAPGKAAQFSTALKHLFDLEPRDK
jgi:glutamyl-tRNA reductase